MKKIVSKESSWLYKVIFLAVPFLFLMTFVTTKAYAEEPEEKIIEDVVQYIQNDGTIKFDEDGEPVKLKPFMGPKAVTANDAKSYFDWTNWQTDPVFDYDMGMGNLPTYDSRRNEYTAKVSNTWTYKVKGDTVARLEDYGRLVGDIENNVTTFTPNATVIIDYPKDWENIPSTPWLGNPTGYTYSVNVQPNKRNDTVNQRTYHIGAYFNKPTIDPKQIPPYNAYTKDSDINTVESVDKVEVKPLVYVFKTDKLGKKVSIGIEFTYKKDGSGAKHNYQANKRFLIPQVMKAKHVDIDTGKELSTEDKTGLNGELNTKVSVSKKDIKDYTYDHYEYIDSKDKTKSGTEGTYSDVMTTTKKGVVFYYKKIPENLTVQFEPNGGAPKPDNQTVKSGELAKEPTGNQVPIRNGYTLEGWYTDSSLTKKYNFSTPVTQNLTLYAKWAESKNWKVTYHTKEKWIDRSSPNPNPESVQDGNKATKPKMDPIGHKYHRVYSDNYPNTPEANVLPTNEKEQDTRIPDMVFLGWYLDENFTKEYDFNTPVHSDVDLYAKWKPNPGAGMMKKAFDRDTLMTTHDDSPYKAPGNKLTDVRINQEFSYMAIARNGQPNREDLEVRLLQDKLPKEVSTPTNLEVFTIEAKWVDNNPYQVIEDYSTLKSHKVPKKSDVTSPDTDEYYEILPNSYGEDILYIRNVKQDKIQGAQYYGFMFDTKLLKRPEVTKDNAGVDRYMFTNKADLHNKNQQAYKPLMDGKFGGGEYILSAYADLHVPWKVDFEPNGGAPKPADQFVRNAKLATEPTGNQVPKLEGKTFGGWYIDKGLTQRYDFNTPVTQDITLYAKWDDFPPDLHLTKTADKKMVEAGETVTYSITMKNSEKTPLKDPKLDDLFPEGMSEPKNVKLDGASVAEGKNNANADGVYYTWNAVERKMILYYKELLGNTEKTVTYESKLLSGKADEKKKNIAAFDGSNTKKAASADYTITVVGPKAILHVKQEVLGKHPDVVIPKTGYLTLDHVRVPNPSDKMNQVSLTMPSYEGDTNQAYKDVSLKLHYGYTGYLPKEIIPEFYEYDGYQLTTNNGNHQSTNKKTGKMPVLNLGDKQEYWLTIYIKAKTSEDGPPFYNWDSKTNDFGVVKNYFDWNNWQKDPVLKFQYNDAPKDSKYKGIYTKYWVETEGDTIARLEDFGRTEAANHVANPPIMEHPEKNPYESWDPEMNVVVINSDLWRNIPQKASVDPVTKDASWQGKMAEKTTRSTNYYFIGGYFLDTTPDPPNIPIENVWNRDDTVSGFSPALPIMKPIVYDYVSKDKPAEVYTQMKIKYNQDVGIKFQAGARNTYIPQIVKVQFRDIDTNKQIAEEQLLGKGGKYKEPVTANAKAVNGYTFDHYEYVDHKDNKKIGAKGDSQWNGELTTTKKGIVFWYKK